MASASPCTRDPNPASSSSFPATIKEFCRCEPSILPSISLRRRLLHHYLLHLCLSKMLLCRLSSFWVCLCPLKSECLILVVLAPPRLDLPLPLEGFGNANSQMVSLYD
ncbi:hypothetical protein V6N13_056989 [Hibiscus sabdariffa]